MASHLDIANILWNRLRNTWNWIQRHLPHTIDEVEETWLCKPNCIQHSACSATCIRMKINYRVYMSLLLWISKICIFISLLLNSEWLLYYFQWSMLGCVNGQIESTRNFCIVSIIRFMKGKCVISEDNIKFNFHVLKLV